MDHADNLLSFDTITRSEMRLARWPEGWTLSVRHAHLGGTLYDCPPFECDRLTTPEMIDVINAELGELGLSPLEQQYY